MPTVWLVWASPPLRSSCNGGSGLVLTWSPRMSYLPFAAWRWAYRIQDMSQCGGFSDEGSGNHMNHIATSHKISHFYHCHSTIFLFALLLILFLSNYTSALLEKPCYSCPTPATICQYQITLTRPEHQLGIPPASLPFGRHKLPCVVYIIPCGNNASTTWRSHSLKTTRITVG